MSPSAILTAVALPPLALVILAFGGGMLSWRGHRRAGGLAAAAAAILLLLSTPAAEGWLLYSLSASAAATRPADGTPGAIIVLGAETVPTAAAPDIGPLTLDRLRAGAALHRATGLPILVTGGPLSPGAIPIGTLMARSLREDFGVPVRWVEDAAPDTRGNAARSVAILTAEGITAAHLVTHAWHLARAREAFSRLSFATIPAPVRTARAPDGAASDWLPRPDHLGGTWFAIREWVGRAVYRLRDG